MLKRFLAILSLTICAVTSLSAQENVENVLIDAVSMIESDDCQGALALLDSAVVANPGNDALHYYTGVCLYSLRKPALAAEHLKKASQLDTTNTWYKEALAAAYVSLGEGDKAGEVYLDLTRTNPRKYRNAYTLTLIADAYRMQRNFPKFFETLGEFARDSSIDPEKRSQYLLSAISGFDARTFAVIAPQIDTLTRTFTEAAPTSYDAHSLRMQIHLFYKNWEGVVEEAAIMATLADDNASKAEMTGVMGDAYGYLGNQRKAKACYEQALKYDPERANTLNNYAWMLCKNGKKLKKAAAMSLKAITKEPDNSSYLDTYGWILYLQGKAKEAKPYFKHAMIYGGKDSATVLRHYSKVLEALGDMDLAKYYSSLAESKDKGQEE